MGNSAVFSFSVLASGSRANSTFVRYQDTSVLIDSGLSAKQTDRRLQDVGGSIGDLQGIVITHEHSDHIAGLPVLMRKYPGVVYMNRATYLASEHLQSIAPERIKYFSTGSSFEIGKLKFESFEVPHDAIEPVGFCITGGGRSLGYITDLGYVTKSVRKALHDIDALVLESNHDLKMLSEAPYPMSLKKRIAGVNGHLGNHYAADFVAEYGRRGQPVQIVVAAHISEKSNTEQCAIEALSAGWDSSVLGNTPRPRFWAASVSKSSPVFSIATRVEKDLESLSKRSERSLSQQLLVTEDSMM